DRKWFARMAAGTVIEHALADLDPQFPSPTDAEREALLRARSELEAEVVPGVAFRSDGPGR
ncbi:MAG: hypothetical protein WBQ18_16920, partial [Solirubrobacteraceae bacterium]